MNRPVPIHAKAQERELLDSLERVASRFLGRATRLKQTGDGRLFALDLAPTDVQAPRVSGPGVIGSLEGEHRAADIAAPIRKVSAMFGDLQNLVTSSDLTKLVQPRGGAAGAQPTAVNPHVVENAYNCKEFSVDVGVPHEVVRNADRDIPTALGEFARAVWKQHREFRVATVLTTSANWAAANFIAPSGGHLWSSTSGVPITDVFAGLAVSRNPRPNTIILPEQVAQYWFSNTTVQAFYMTGALEQLQLRPICVRAKYQSGGSPKDIWAQINNYAVLCVGDGLGNERDTSLTTAATARWIDDKIEHASVPRDEQWVYLDGLLIRCFWENSRGARGFDHCIIECNEDVVIIDNTLGALIGPVA